MRANRTEALQLYLEVGLDRKGARDLVRFIDIRRRARRVLIPYGSTAQAWVGAGGPGRHFSRLGATQLGVGIVPDPNKLQTLVQFLRDTPAIESFTRARVVYPLNRIISAGGALQYFVADVNAWVVITRMLEGPDY
jgi:hypothetical protein